MSVSLGRVSSFSSTQFFVFFVRSFQIVNPFEKKLGDLLLCTHESLREVDKLPSLLSC